MWIDCNDWLPGEGVWVEVCSFDRERHIAYVQQEPIGVESTTFPVWRDRFYNHLIPRYWTLLREGPKHEE